MNLPSQKGTHESMTFATYCVAHFGSQRTTFQRASTNGASENRHRSSATATDGTESQGTENTTIHTFSIPVVSGIGMMPRADQAAARGGRDDANSHTHLPMPLVIPMQHIISMDDPFAETQQVGIGNQHPRTQSNAPDYQVLFPANSAVPIVRLAEQPFSHSQVRICVQNFNGMRFEQFTC